MYGRVHDGRGSVEYASHMACRNSGMLMHGDYVAVSRSMWKVMEPWSHVFKAHWGLHLFFSYKLWLQLYLSLTSVILLGEPLSAGYLIRTARHNTRCSSAIRVWAFQTLQFDPSSLKHSMLSRSLASRWSVLEGGITVSSNYSCYEFSFNELGS